MALILVADDEASIRDVVQYALERDGHRVVSARNGAEALRLAQEQPPDLVVLDVLMPELDGLAVCRRLRERGDVPVLFLSSRAEEVDRILGLELGGDDYVVKPFSPRELAARVASVLRRARPAAQPAQARTTMSHAGVRMDRLRHEVRAGQDRVELTVTEFEILWALLERPGVVLSRAQLLDRARGEDVHVTERTVDSHVRRLRAKLRPADPVETVHGVGYRAREGA